MMKAAYFLPLFVLFLIVCWGFQEIPTKTRAQLVEEEVARQLTSRRARFEQKCREDVLLAAAVVADSIILERAYETRDTTGRPPRPNRPVRPDALRPRDSADVAPLLPRKKEKQ